jgi:hypothetical protein
MKFAKTLGRVVKLAAPFCAEENWLDYKALKKALHACERGESSAPLGDLGERMPFHRGPFTRKVTL